MKVRGWVILGGPGSERGLPPAASAGTATAAPPDPMEFEPGRWVLWQATPGGPMIVLVCVEIPL